MKTTNKTLIAALIQLTLAGAAQADTAQVSSVGDVQRNIEQNRFGQPPAGSEEKAVQTAPQGDMTRTAISKLVRVEVEGNIERKKIQNYFSDMIGKPVTEAQLDSFNGWVWGVITRSGYLAYASTSQQLEGDGSVLRVNVLQPTVRTLRVAAENESVSRRYEKLLISRFSDVVLPGKPLDLQYLENRIASANFDLPIDIHASIQQSDPGKVDLVLHVKEVPPELGKFAGGFLQGNNYGLRQYGRAQMLGSVAFGGFTPFSELTLTGLAADGIGFTRAEYEFPTETLKGKVRLWGSYTESRSVLDNDTDTRGRTSEYGASLTNVIGTTRDAVFKSRLELMTRHTTSSLVLNGIEQENLRDNKARLAFSADNDALSLDHYRYELSFTSGRYSTMGSYNKQELSGQVERTLSDDGKWLGSVRFHGQLASTNLDSYDKISLGGVNGVRAYSTDDGVGDEGLVLSLDLIKHFGNNQYVGVFYDAGVVKPNRNPVAGAFNNSYTLQGAGVEFGGRLYKALSYSLTVAKGLGPYAGYVDRSIESSPRNLRFLFAVSNQF